MMKNLTGKNFQWLVIAFTSLSIAACNSRQAIPFPEGETEFIEPVTRTLHFTAAQKINWIVNKADSIAAPEEKNLDLNKIPSAPFFGDGFKTFAVPPAEEKLDWNNLPSIPFDIDTVASIPLAYKTIRVNAPEKIKAGIPKTKAPVSKNIIQLGQEEGLPGGVVQQIYQDKKGIYWIATGKGLCRYDGEYFELFSFISKEPQGSILVSKILEDKSGRIWITTQSRGVYIFDYSNGMAKNIKYAGYDLAPDANGNIWMLDYSQEISVIDPEKLTLRKTETRKISDSGEVARVINGDNNQLLFRTVEGISILDLHKKKIFKWDSKVAKDYSTINYFSKTSSGNILTATKESIDIIHPATSVVQHFSKAQGLENMALNFGEMEDNEGRIWHAKKDSGIEALDFKNNALLKLGKQDGLSENSISCMYKDSDGKIWIGTNTGGINIIDNDISINHLSVNQGLSKNDIWSMIEDDQKNIWIGTSGGIDILNTEQHFIKHLDTAIQMGKGYIAIPKLMKDKKGLIWAWSANNALSVIDVQNNKVKIYDKKNIPVRRGIKLLGDSRGMVWITTFGEGIVVFDPIKNICRHLTTANGLAGNLPWSILEDKAGRIWVATSKGVSIIEADGETISNLHKSDGLSDNVTQALAQDSLGRIWISTNEGIDMLDMNKKTSTSFAKKQGMTENESYALEVLNNKIYAGTSSGISIIENVGQDSNKWRIKTLARPQGFYYLDVNSNTSLISKSGKIYWGIQEVLTVMDEPKEDSIVKPAYITGIKVNGLQEYFYTVPNTSSAAGFADTTWSERNDTFYTKQNLHSTFTKGQRIQWKSSGGLFNMPVGLELAYNQNQLGFQFTGMHTSNVNKVRYRYILEGLDNHWGAITEQAQSPVYNNLSAGEYTFKVCSKGANGLWSKPAEFSFTILPPWWKTWWAYTLYALGFVGIVRAYIGYRSQRLKQENIILEEKIGERTNELKQSIDHLKATQSQLIQSEKMASLGELTAGIAHEIQNPLNFVNNFSEVNTELIEEMKTELAKGNQQLAIEIANDIKENEERINHHGKRADAIVKGMLQHSRSSNGLKQPTDINALVDEYLRLAYHGLRAKDKSFNATLKTDYDESIGNINIIPQDIGRVLLNLINNAFYAVNPASSPGERNEPIISITTKKLGDKILISIKDNGTGISQKVVDKIFQPFFTTKPTGQGTGLGLSLSYDIIKAHGGELAVKTKEGEGAEFIITLNQ